MVKGYILIGKPCTDDSYHSKTKHIDVRFHINRELISNGVVTMSTEFSTSIDAFFDIFEHLSHNVSVYHNTLSVSHFSN